MMGIIDKCWVRGDATLCVVIFKGLPTTSEDLSVFVLFLLFKVSDFSRKPFCFRFVFLRFPTLVGNLSVFVLSFLY